MSDTILDAVRAKYPQYKDVPDDQLTYNIGKKFPQYLGKDKDFDARFKSLTPTSDLNEPATIDFHTSLWQKFRGSTIGTDIMGPTPMQRQAMAETGMGPPRGQPGILPLMSQLPIGPGPESKLGKALFGYYIASYAKSQPERVKQITQQIKTGDKHGAINNIVEDLLGGAMTAGAVKGIYDEFAPKPSTTGAPNAKGIRENQGQPSQAGQVTKEGQGAGGQNVQQTAPGPSQPVGQGAQVPLEPHQADAAENFWSNATDMGKERLVGKSGYANKGWQDLTDEEKYTVAQKTGALKAAKPEVPKVEDVNLTGLDPEHQEMLKIERGNVDVPVDPVSDKDMKGDDPFARVVNEMKEKGLVATVDRANNRIIFDPVALNDWLKDIPQSQRQKALRSLISEERIHLGTDDADAKAYNDNLTGVEKAINVRRYLGPRPKDPKAAAAWDSIKNNPVLMGHEALRFRMQQLSRMTPREIASTAGAEKWTLKGLTLVETAIRGVREALGTKASKESLAILDKIQKNIDLAKPVTSGSSPGTIDKNIQDRAEKEAKELEEQAKMYIESGDVEAGNELNEMAKKLRDQTSQQYFPGVAKPLPGERTVKVQRQDGSTYEASFGGKFYDYPGRGKVASIAKQLPNGQWTHGMLGPGEKILDELPGMARPKKRKDSVFQEGFILPGMETQKLPGSAEAVPTTAYDPEGELVSEPPSTATPESRVSAEASGALPRLTAAQIDEQGRSWVHTKFLASQEASKEGKKPAPPKFDDFVSYVRGLNPALKPGQMFEMWQNTVADAVDQMKGDDLQAMAKQLFQVQPSTKGISAQTEHAKAAAKAKTQEEFSKEWMQAGSTKEGGRSIWDRKVPEAREPGQDDVITEYGNREKEIHNLQQQLEQVEEPRMAIQRMNEPSPTGELGLNMPSFRQLHDTMSAAAAQFSRRTQEFNAIDGQLQEAKKNYYRQGIGAEAKAYWKDEVATLQKERNEALKTLHDVRLAQAWLKKNPKIKFEKQQANPEATELKEQIVEAKRANKAIEEDYKRAISGQNWRSRVKSAIYRRMVKPQMEESDAKLNRKEITPDDIRHGAPYAYEDINKVTTPELEKILRDTGGRQSQGAAKVGRSREQAQNVTKRLLVIRNKNSGTVHIVDVYPRGAEMRVMDPMSPMKEHALLSSIQNRYDLLHTVLLDEPVRNFRQDFKNLPDYMRKFGRQAEADKQQALGFEPTTVPQEEFIKEVGGRIPGSEEGHLQGPAKKTVVEAGEGALEAGETIPTTDAEMSALMDYVKNAKNPSHVEDLLRDIDPKKNRQVFSAFAKLARSIGKEFPFATPDELVDKLSQRISDAQRQAKSREEFQKLLSPTDKGSTELPGVTRRQKVRSFARGIWDDLFRLSNQYLADIEQSFDYVDNLRKQYENDLPQSSIDKVFHRLDEEHTLGKSDIPLRTENEQKLFDEASLIYASNKAMYERLRKIDPDTAAEVWPRMAKDVNSPFQRVKRGVKRGVTEGNIISPSAWFTKRRLIKALVGPDGTRQVGVITSDGDMVVYDKGKGTNLGEFAWSDTQKRYDKFMKDLEPINRERHVLQDAIEELERTEARKEASKRLINAKKKRLAELDDEKAALEEANPIDDLNDKVWVDKNKKQWTIKDATVKEIEENMDTRFYHEPFSVLIAQNLKLKQMTRAANWMEKFKSSDDFHEIAAGVNDMNVDPTWKQTSLPQMRGYKFEPRVADVLDQFHERSQSKGQSALTAMNRFMMNAVFFSNPFLHTPNLAAWWFTTRGAFAYLKPSAYPRMIKSFTKAFNDVANKTPDYVAALRAGTPLQFTRMRQFSDNVTSLLRDELDQDKTMGQKLSNWLGYANPIKLSQAIGHAATAGLHDVLTMQLIHELRMKYPDMSLQAAMHEITRIMPDYRVPPRILGSRNLSKAMANPNILWFGAYHYAEGKAFTNMAKDLAVGDKKSKAGALDKIAATALLATVAYPILDDILQKITGRKDLAFRRAGPTTWPTAIYDVAAGNRAPQQVGPSFISVAPGVTIPISLLYNVALGGRSLPIYNPKRGVLKAGEDITKYTASQVNQGAMFRDLQNGSTDWETIVLNLAGIRKDYTAEPSSKIYGWAYDWAKQTGNQKLLNQFNERAMEVYPPSKYTPLKNDLDRGNTYAAANDIKKLIASGTSPDLIERELRPDAHPLSGLRDTESQFFDSLSPEQKQIYQEEVAKREKIYQRYLDLPR